MEMVVVVMMVSMVIVTMGRMMGVMIEMMVMMGFYFLSVLEARSPKLRLVFVINFKVMLLMVV